MEHFTPVSSLIGGGLIGLSAVILMLLNGRIAGISGITAGLLPPLGPVRDWGWRAAFVLGLVVSPFARLGAGLPQITFVTSTQVMTVAGFLVGFGTVLGNGCTSGHGVCGMARLSRRSLVGTLVFMASGAATTFLSYHLGGN